MFNSVHNDGQMVVLAEWIAQSLTPFVCLILEEPG